MQKGQNRQLISIFFNPDKVVGFFINHKRIFVNDLD